LRDRQPIADHRKPTPATRFEVLDGLFIKSCVIEVDPADTRNAGFRRRQCRPTDPRVLKQRCSRVQIRGDREDQTGQPVGPDQPRDPAVVVIVAVGQHAEVGADPPGRVIVIDLVGRFPEAPPGPALVAVGGRGCRENHGVVIEMRRVRYHARADPPAGPYESFPHEPVHRGLDGIVRYTEPLAQVLADRERALGRERAVDDVRPDRIHDPTTFFSRSTGLC